MARQSAVHKGTINKAGVGHREPALRHMLGIIRFVSYAPFELGESLPERLRFYRMIHGISREKLAGMLGVDEGYLLALGDGAAPTGQEVRGTD